MASKTAAVIGAGLAGTEAALVLARKGVAVDLYEMRPGKRSPAHTTDLPAELVCSNSFKSLGLHSAHGVLKEELAILESPVLAAAKRSSVAAGSALAVDRLKFSEDVAAAIARQPLINCIHEELSSPPENDDACIIAAGPLASDNLTDWVRKEISETSLHFYDAIAPIIAADSIDMRIAFLASRNDETSIGDYLNCPFNREEYLSFYQALVEEDRVNARAFEDATFFEACLPVEVMAGRGERALAFGPLKPVGLTDPRTGRWPFAVCQLRKENEAGTCYNMVGFQTRLTIPGQQRVFRMIPGLENAEFLRYGSIHRNTYLDSPKLLSDDLSFKTRSSLFLAGQLCGSEGYTESIATGHLAALSVLARFSGKSFTPPPRTTALGALLHHVTASGVVPFAPSNIHFGLFAPMPDNGKRIKKKANRDLLSARALSDLKEWAMR